GTMNLVVPAVVSNALLRKLSVGFATAKRKARPDSNERLQVRLLACPFQAELCMNSVTVALSALATLVPGDLLVLRRRIDLAGEFIVAGQDMFHANVARVGQQRAAKLLDRCPAPEKGRKIAP